MKNKEKCHRAPWLIKNVILPFFEKNDKVFSDDLIKDIQDIISCYCCAVFEGNPEKYYKNIIEGCESTYHMMREKQFDYYSKDKMECLFYAKIALKGYWERLKNK